MIIISKRKAESGAFMTTNVSDAVANAIRLAAFTMSGVSATPTSLDSIGVAFAQAISRGVKQGFRMADCSDQHPAVLGILSKIKSNL